jgi:hydrogenase nickel incorporation protein HypB
MRLVLLSVTEGEDKPLKYPTMFNSADVAVITKIDLADPCDFDREAAHAAIAAVRPGMTILELSARTGAGLAAWHRLLRDRRDAWRADTGVASAGA